MPILFSTAPVEKPSQDDSTINALIPFTPLASTSVLANTVTKSQQGPLVIKHLRPFRM